MKAVGDDESSTSSSSQQTTCIVVPEPMPLTTVSTLLPTSVNVNNASCCRKVQFIDCHSENYELNPDTLEPVLSGTILGKTVIKQVQKCHAAFYVCIEIDNC
ncbi:hypothetical protein JTB14_036767 [Gonioctena quinquepunctata]|nr:hypothetical protein JTB14_036767 [Gonioctena quinquepunctata]